MEVADVCHEPKHGRRNSVTRHIKGSHQGRPKSCLQPLEWDFEDGLDDMVDHLVSPTVFKVEIYSSQFADYPF